MRRLQVEDGVVNQPAKCRHCAQSHVMRLMPNRCQYINRQVVKMQVRRSCEHT